MAISAWSDHPFGSARLIRWDGEEEEELVRWDADGGIFDVTHVKVG
jgi:hypothetical protein